MTPRCRSAFAFVSVATISLLAAPTTGHSTPVQPSAGLVIRGPGNSFADVVWKADVTLLAEESVVETIGSYGGFAIYSLPDLRFKGGFVTVPAFEETNHPFGPLPYSRREIELRGGSYRIFLLGDAATSIDVPAAGLRRPARIVTSEPASIDAEVLDLSSLPSAPHAARNVPVEIRENSRVFMVALQVAEHHQASRMDVCVTERGGRECLLGGRPSNGALFMSPGGLFDGHFMSIVAGMPREGPSDLVFRVDGVGLANTLLGFYLIVHTDAA
jgi:hypothetical protein